MTRIGRALGGIGSAHVIAILALCLALGGGYAIAAKKNEPKPTVGYHQISAEQRTQPAGRENLVSQLVVPSKNLYAVSAKLDVAKGSGNEFADGPVTCYLGGVGERDSAAVTVRKGDVATLALQTMGGQVTTGGDEMAWDLSCSGFESSYVVADVRMTAVRLDRAKFQ
jgi:hypothetical protein